MELPELEQGLQNIQQAETAAAPDAAPDAAAPWLSMDSLMQGYGGWFGNDKGLGEMLLGQLRAHNVDTQAATEAMLRQILQGLVDDMNVLQERLMGFTQATAQQLQNAQNVTDAIETALVQSGASPMAQDIQPPMDAGAPVEPPVGPEGGTPPAPEGPAPEGDMPPAEPPADAGAPASEEPPAEPPALEGDVPPEGVPSDRKIKKVYTLSDAGKKRIMAKLKARNRRPLSSNIIGACQGGF